TATPRSVTSFTASNLNSFVNFRLTMSDLRSLGHDLIFVSTKPAAGHPEPEQLDLFRTLNIELPKQPA
ncbi:MAG: hypothetical protein ACXIU7_01745, partial [Roseinatronobacter sp.]